MSLCSFFSEVVAASQHQPWIAEGETNFFLLAILVASGSQVTQILYWPVGWQNPDTTQMISEICYLLRVVKPSSVTKSLQHHGKITAKSLQNHCKIIQNHTKSSFVDGLPFEHVSLPSLVWPGLPECEFCWSQRCVPVLLVRSTNEILLVGYS